MNTKPATVKAPKGFKPYAPEKLKELMLKFRKGATAAFGPRELAAIVTAVGGSCEERVVLVPLFGEDEPSKEHWFSNALQAAAFREHYETAPTLASPGANTPVEGTIYVEQFQVKEVPSDASNTAAVFESRAYMANAAYVFTVPGSAEPVVVTADAYDLQSYATSIPRCRPRARLSLYRVWGPLKETNLERLVCESLGMEPHRPGAKRVLDNTGTCGCCFENMKRESNSRGALVLHGYRRPGDGATHGRCYGVGYRPFEVSPEATQEYLTDVLVPQHERAQRHLAFLLSGEVKSLTVGRGNRAETVVPGHDLWAYYLRCEQDSARRAEERERSTREAYERLIQYWEPRPLPVDGEYQKDWFYYGQIQASEAK